MLRHLLILPDGTEVCSGAPGAALMAVTLTREVNSGTLLCPGAVSAAMLQLTLLSPNQIVRAGDTLQLCNGADRSPIGYFIAQEPMVSGQLQKITAYDRLILLDRDITPFLQTLSWPQTLLELAKATCEECGLTLINTELPNGDFPVSCPAGGVTGRQLMMWIAQAAGCFCCANARGEAELRWYTPGPLELSPCAIRCLGGALTLPGRVEAGVLQASGTVAEGVLSLQRQQYILSEGLQLEAAPILPIDRVQLRQTDEDVGYIHPDAPGENTLVIQGNPLLAAADATTLQPIAEGLYSRFAGISYTPGVLKLPTTEGLEVGQLLTVTDRAGDRHAFYVMRLQRTASGDTITCTGSFRRDSAGVVNNRSYETLAGKVLQLRTDVDGIFAENSDSRGRLSSLSLELEGIRGTVSRQEAMSGRLTQLEQTAQGLQLSVETLEQQGATAIKTAMGYTFDDQGLRIARSGQPMENRLDNTGMRVLRSGKPILQADHQGVTARDVTVENYLIVGSFARFEDYGVGRTACFRLE